MEPFWKAAALILLTVILGVTIGKSEKDIAVVLTMAACCAVVTVAVRYLSEVIGFLWELGSSVSGQTPLLDILLRISGTALATEITGMICCDAGSHSLGKVMQILGNTVMIFLALPVFDAFFTMIRNILGMI